MNRQRSKSKPQRDYQSHLRDAMRKHLPHKGLALTHNDSRVRWSDRMLVIAAILLSWSKVDTLTDAFSQSREAVVAMYRSRKRPGKTSRGLFDALRTRGARLAGLLKAHLQGETIRRAGSRWHSKRWVGLAVDGSRVDCPRTRANEAGFGRGGRKKTRPQQWVTTLYHVATGLMWDYRLGKANAAERTHLREMLPYLPTGTLLLMDAGFTGYDLLQSILTCRHDFIVRVGANVSLLRELECDGDVGKSTVWLWPAGKRRRHSPLRLRKVEFQHKGRRVCLLTSVMSKAALSNCEVKAWYRLRWGIEVQFRSLKQTLGHRKMLGHCPSMARAELEWALLGLWLLEVMLVHNQHRRPGRYSMAGGLRVVRDAMRETGRVPAGGVARQLRHAQQDTYERHGSKKARNWPHKKKDPPCGTPKLRTATAQEQQQAKAFRERKAAA
jgi:hypothetical protein